MGTGKILVAGGTGFLGSSVVQALEARGGNFLSMSLRHGVDFRNMEQTLDLFRQEKFGSVINCAVYGSGGILHVGRDKTETFYNNTMISTNLLEAARLTGVQRFVNPISNCTYPGHLLKDFKEDDWWSGPLHESVLVYAFVRKASWVQSLAYYQQYGLETMNLILPNMYGPRDHFDETRSHALGALITKFVKAWKNKEPEVVVWGTGRPVREWLYVADGAEVLIRALDVRHTPDPVNVGVGKGISISKLAELIREVVGFKGHLQFDTTKPDGAPYRTMDNARLKEIFNWVPSTELREGVEKTVKWYLENGDNN